MTPMPTTTQTPVEVDTQLAALYSQVARLQYSLNVSQRMLADKWCSETSRERIKKDMRKEANELGNVQDKITPLEAIYEVKRWNRYYLVKNANGHVHSTMACTTCFYDTQFGWLVDLADKPVADMIEEWGEMACTVCFPDAPTFPRFSQPSKRDQAAQDARAAEKAARDAKKAEKNLTPEQCFKGHSGWKITTVAGAKQALRDAVEMANYGAWGDAHPWAPAAAEAAVRATEVLLERGVPQAELDKIVANKMKALKKEFGQ